MVKRKSSKRSMFELERELKAERARNAELRERLARFEEVDHEPAQRLLDRMATLEATFARFEGCVRTVEKFVAELRADQALVLNAEKAIEHDKYLRGLGAERHAAVVAFKDALDGGAPDAIAARLEGMARNIRQNGK